MRPVAERPRPSVWPALLVFAIALVLRLAHVAAMRRSPYFAHPVLDAGTYYDAALALVEGRGSADPVFWQPPGYPCFLALILAVSGSGGLWISRVVQAVGGAVSAALTGAIGARLFGPGVGLAAGLGAAVYGPLIYFDGELLTPSLAILLQLGATWCAVRAGQKPRPAAWFASGLLGGLTAIVNAPALLLVPVMAAFARRRAGWVLVGAALAIAPVTLRNWVAGGQVVLISSNGGVNLFLGNNPRYDAMVGMRPGRDWQALLRAPRQYGVTGAAAASRFFVGRVRHFAGADPVGFIRLQARKLRLLVSGTEIPRNQEIYPARAYSHVLRALLWKTPILAFPFGLLLPVGVLGLVVGARRAPMLAVMLVGLAGAVVAFFVTARYRAPLVPLLLVFAAEGARWWVRSARTGARVWAAALVLVLLVAANAGQGPMPARMNPDAEFGLATWLEREGRREEAGALYERVARENPTYWDAWYRLGQFREAEGRPAAAAEAFRTARGIVPEYFDTLLVLGNIRAAEGRFEEAVDYYRRALALEPGDPLVPVKLGEALRQLGDPAGPASRPAHDPTTPGSERGR